MFGRVLYIPLNFATKWRNLTLQAPTPLNGQTNTIIRQQPTNCFSVFDHFEGLVLKGLTHSSST